MGTVDLRNVKYLFIRTVVLFTSRRLLRKLDNDSKALYRKIGIISTKLIKINAVLIFQNILFYQCTKPLESYA